MSVRPSTGNASMESTRRSINSAGGGRSERAATPMSLAQTVYASCCAARNVKPNVQILLQLRHVAAPSIQHVDASQTFLGSQGIRALLDFVHVHQGLRSINLSQNGIDADGVRQLCDLLLSHQALEEVDLSRNRLSVPSARLLWETAKSSRHVQVLRFLDCQLLEEWENRINRCLEQNSAFYDEGFLPPAKRPKGDWENVFVAIIGTEHLVDVLVDQVLSVLSSIAADASVRVVPMVVRETDSQEEVYWKINATRDAFNYKLPRFVALLDQSNFDAPWIQVAIQFALSIAPPEIQPLKNKLGQQREAVAPLAAHAFVYAFDSVRAQQALWDQDTRFAGLELSDIEQTRNTAFLEYMSAISCSLPYCRTYVFHHEDALVLRAQTEIGASLSQVYSGLIRETEDSGDAGVSGSESPTSRRESGDPSSPQSADVTDYYDVNSSSGSPALDSMLARTRQVYRRLAPVGEMHPQDVDEVMRYVDAAPSSQAFPMVLYGGDGVGKSNVAAAACMRLAQRLVAQESQHHPSQHLGPSLDTPRHVGHVVAPFYWGHQTTRSPIILSYALLALFGCPWDAIGYHQTLESLAEACRNAMASYSGQKRITVFLVGLDKIDGGGKRDFNVLSCIAATLPPTVRVVITLATESPLLVGFRNRQPQPFERLVRCLAPAHLIQIIASKLSTGVYISGISDAEEASASSATASAVAKVLLSKEDAESSVFCELVGLTLNHTDASAQLKSDASDGGGCAAVVNFISGMPGTLHAVLRGLIDNIYAKRFNPDALRAALLALVVAPLPLTELVCICEAIALAPKHSVLPLVIQLIRDGILVMYSDALVHIASPPLIHGIREIYGHHAVDGFGTIMASHLHRLVVTHSPEMNHAFRRCVPLLIESMQNTVVESLVLDPVVVDHLLSFEQRSHVFVIDAIYRLIHADATLLELLVNVGHQFKHHEKRRALQLALFQLQTMPLTVVATSNSSNTSSDSGKKPRQHSNFFQVSLLAHPDSPYRRAAEQLVNRVDQDGGGPEQLGSSLNAIGGAQPPYACLVRRNDIGQEAASVLSIQLSDEVGIHCHAHGDLQAVTTPRRVRLLLLSSLTPPATPIGATASSSELVEPFGSSVPLLGAVVASDTKVVVVAVDQILLWDVAVGSISLIPDITVSLSGESFDLTRTAIIGVVASTGQIAAVDVNKKRVLYRVPMNDAPQVDILADDEGELLVSECGQEGQRNERGEPSSSVLPVIGLPYGFCVREVQFVGIRHMIVAVGTYDVALIFVDRDNECIAEEPCVILPVQGFVRAVATSPDGKYVITASGSDMQMWTWRGELLHVVSGSLSSSPASWHTGRINHVAFHPNGSMFASCSDDGTVKLWKTLSGLLAEDLPVDLSDTQYRIPVIPRFVQFSADGTRLFARCDDFVRQWDAVTYQGAGAVRAASRFINFISISTSHVTAVTSGGDIKVWNTKCVAFPSTSDACAQHISSDITRESKITNAPIRSVKVAPTGDWLVARDATNEVTVWSLATGRLITKLSGVAAFCPLDQSTLFTVEQNRIVVFSLNTNEIVSSMALPRDQPAVVDVVGYEVAFSADQAALFLAIQAMTATRIYIFDLPSFKLSNVFQGHYDDVVYMSKIHDDLFLTASLDGTVRLWSLGNHAERTSFSHSRAIVSAIEVVGGQTSVLDHPILFLDEDGNLFDVFLYDALVPEKSRFRVEQKKVARPTASSPRSRKKRSQDSAAASLIGDVSNNKGSTSTRHRRSSMSSTSSISGPSRSKKIRYASRLSHEHLLLGDEGGALYILDEAASDIITTIPSAGCSCVPQIRGNAVLVGTHGGSLDIYTKSSSSNRAAARNSQHSSSVSPEAQTPSSLGTRSPTM